MSNRNPVAAAAFFDAIRAALQPGACDTACDRLWHTSMIRVMAKRAGIKRLSAICGFVHAISGTMEGKDVV